MNHSKYDKNRSWRQSNLTAVLVDYENLYQILTARLQDDTHPDEFIIEMLEELHRYLQGKDLFQIAISKAYADFSAIKGDGVFIQQTLQQQGLAPCFVSGKYDTNAASVQLCLDASSLLYTREDIESFVLITGDRIQLPLVQHLRSYGKNVLAVSLETIPDVERITHGHETFLNVVDLLSESTRKLLGDLPQPEGAPRAGNFGRRLSRPSHATQRDATHLEITDNIAYDTLRVIEEHFGQYDEVYLTPLLRKLSESLDDQQNDPKSIINKLEDAGAVWLEKRRGFPYDYTVLLVDGEHPDVRQIQEDLANRSPGEYTRGYYAESYEEDVDFEDEAEFDTPDGFEFGDEQDPGEEKVGSVK